MKKDLKKKIFKMNLLLVSSCVLFSSCKNKTVLDEQNTKKIEFVKKETKYKKDETTDVLIDDDHIKKEDIVKIIKHGDHWHVFTKDGKEHITYKDPEKLGNDDFSLVSVVSKTILKSLDVVKILKHGDHFHVYTRDGSEYLTYENPASIFPNITIGTYTGTHSTNNYRRLNVETPSNESSSNSISINKIKEDEVVKILKHGDHFHIYTKSGKEFISYKDPSKKYPHITIGTYHGSHGKTENKKIIDEILKEQENKREDFSKKHLDRLKSLKDNLTIINVLGKGEVNRYDIVKILKHEDHYHIYDSQGNEGITYENPRLIYPNAYFGEYNGKHNENKKENNKKEQKINWPKGVTKIIDHGDHWHLYVGDREVGVVHVNPKNIYPNAEYIKENNNHSDIKVEKEEEFSYDSVGTYLKDGILDYLDDNLKSMTNFGTLNDKKNPIYGSNGEYKNIFYWLHNDHYHAITIKQIIQNKKAGSYGVYSAKDVVAAIKWIIKNPQKLKDLEKKEEEKITVSQEKIKNFLENYYKMEVQIIGNKAYIYASKTYEFNFKDFYKKDDKIFYKKDLPKIEKENENKSENKKEIEKETESLNKKMNHKEKIAEENLKKLMNILKLSKDEVEDKIMDTDIILSDSSVNADGTISYKGKIYKLI